MAARMPGRRRAWPGVADRAARYARAIINNDVLRSLRYLLDLGDAHVVGIVRLADPAFALDRSEIPALLEKEDAPGFVACSDAVLLRFLDGLIFHRRGRDESLPPREIEKRVSNNLVLKKLRVAFALKDADMQQVFRAADFEVSLGEVGALCRQRGHKNYRACGDQMLRNFLKGLTLRLRPAR